MSLIFPAPTLDAKARPVDWYPSSTGTLVPLGHLQVLFAGYDVTYYRDVPTKIVQWSSADPFDDEIAIFEFPQITPFEPLPVWLRPGAFVEIILQPPTGPPRILWEGMYVSEDDQTELGVRAHCIGALFQLDLYVASPRRYNGVVDVGQAIYDIVADPQRAGINITPPPIVTTGAKTWKSGAFDAVLSGAIRELLGYAQTNTETANPTQWTVMKTVGRHMELRIRDRTTIDYTFRCGAPGVAHDLQRDWTTAPNAIYGEGTAPDGCRWRGTRFPFVHPGPIIGFSGTLTIGSSGQNVKDWKRRAKENGWPVILDSTFTADDAEVVRQMQRRAGFVVTGTVNAQTWAWNWDNTNTSDDSLATIAPIAILPQAEAYVYGPSGAVVGTNPSYDQVNVLRVERYETFGERIGLIAAGTAARHEILRDYPAHYTGQIVLSIDPPEGSRFEIKAGTNILLQGHRGVDRVFHIVGVVVDPNDVGTVTCTVDTAARDLLTVQAITERAYELKDPLRRAGVANRASTTTQDRTIQWDCEGGSGMLPRMEVTANTWKVVRVAAGEYGQVGLTRIACDGEHSFVAAVFPRAVTVAQLNSWGDPDAAGFWEDIPTAFWPTVAWGGVTPLGVSEYMGYWPSRETFLKPRTGIFQDEGSWTFSSERPPWLWFAIRVEASTIVEGQLYISIEDN